VKETRVKAPAPAERIALDTSVLVAALCSWHERHADSLAALEACADAGHVLVTPAHALVETYAVLTRLPPPHRLSPGQAWALIERSLRPNVEVASFTADTTWSVLADASQLGVAGGRTFDFVLAASARARACTRLLTWNTRHFQHLAGAPLAVEPPAVTGEVR
jgi:predicted nucleic acid-binding protein